MINLSAFIGEPLYFENICKIYPPTIKEVVSNPKYPQRYKLLTITEDDIRDQLKNSVTNDQYPTPFEFLLVNCHYNQQFLNIAYEAFNFFIREEVTFLLEQRIIIIGSKEEVESKIKDSLPLRILDENNYFAFQNMVRSACGEAQEKPPEPIDPNEDPRIRRIKEKARERDRIKKKKGTQGGITLDTLIVSICCMDLGITPLNIGEMSYAALGELIKTYQNKEKYDLDVRSLLAGADSKKIKPKYWIRNTD